MCLFHFLETKPASLFLFQQPLPPTGWPEANGRDGRARGERFLSVLSFYQNVVLAVVVVFLLFFSFDSFSSFFSPSPRQVYQRAAQNSATHDRSVQPSRLVIGVSTTASRRCRVSSLGGARHRNWANGTPNIPLPFWLCVCLSLSTVA